MYNEKRIRKSEFLQIILLDNLYAQSGSERIIFQGGTALRWIYAGMRFSEDLDFVTGLSKSALDKILGKLFSRVQTSCMAQFGPGRLEVQPKGRRKEAAKIFFIYRPETERERIAVKLEFEFLEEENYPEFEGFILRDLPMVAGLMTSGELIMPYSSSIIQAETIDEILSDKIRALFEREYIKGRDIYNIWWMKTRLGVKPNWSVVRKKFSLYQAPFIRAREIDYFQKRASKKDIIEALERDLPRFLPKNIISIYTGNRFEEFISALNDVTSDLLKQGMRSYFKKND